MDEPGAPDEHATDPNAHAFVVKVWREEGQPNKHAIPWRGYVVHVASGKRRYITTLNQLNRFIVGYVRELHVKVPLMRRLCHWWNE